MKRKLVWVVGGNCAVAYFFIALPESHERTEKGGAPLSKDTLVPFTLRARVV